MIDWIVASHKEDVLQSDLLATLRRQEGDTVHVVREAPSITYAYSWGQANTAGPIRVYVHHDVRILDNDRLRQQLCDAVAEPNVGLVGIIGSRVTRMPWWLSDCLGSVIDARLGLVNFGPGGPCVMLDGLLLATTQTVEWDLAWPGWHGYDQDACTQMTHRGLQNWCLSDGHTLVEHHAVDSPIDLAATSGYFDAVEYYKRKWG